ncbi:SDR family NAD(P)-dependent oxidoreductase [Aliivibrio fischeri]|uniref:SDR family NAD(P)-dependent oxidoreductase n=1 Tax=Aliivibrio fischeri TaxID=668 RepID=UPI0007C49304|nr:SDR family oxidoreductase [Aliivibrio fischeri]MCE7566307.1 SDR family oxidoreductase [Aliivibrio fischeri]MUK67966.1 SDR family oxidoreductase [Aliivibrio fischeri]MUK72913.1 SDR family oxidoreductase [Aliivibrio fischeri]MUK77045.1 SDR family oxidoreductase [Aliivibrio fischeri]
MPLNIVITGSRKGLGKELSEYYLSLGHTVIGCSRQSGSIEHANYHHFELDVADEKSVIKMVRTIRKTIGVVDVLINNAGIAAMNHFLTTPLSSAERVISTNVMGTFLFSREVAKLMMKQKSGSIVNYSTVAVPLDLEGEAIYAASKAAVESLTRISAKELSHYGIRVNAIGPTPIPTDLIKTVPKNKIEELIASQAIKRLGSSEDVINVIDFFISPKSDFITGQVIYLGGVFK